MDRRRRLHGYTSLHWYSTTAPATRIALPDVPGNAHAFQARHRSPSSTAPATRLALVIIIVMRMRMHFRTEMAAASAVAKLRQT